MTSRLQIPIFGKGDLYRIGRRRRKKDPITPKTLRLGARQPIAINRNYHAAPLSPGFKRDQLKARYDVERIEEDAWHSYSGEKTSSLVSQCLSQRASDSRLLLNAGSGIYEIGAAEWHEVAVDIFSAPLKTKPHAICASVEALPFKDSVFGAVVCVGEVLAYCDPAAAIREFARVLVPEGLLICDFGSTRGFRYWLRPPYGRAADLVTEQYNGTPEHAWIYDPKYLSSILESLGFSVQRRLGTHTWSALARRMGLSMNNAVTLQRRFDWLRLPASCADLMTIVASRNENGK
jgi:SAM-dependent methyltransferase